MLAGGSGKGRNYVAGTENELWLCHHFLYLLIIIKSVRWIHDKKKSNESHRVEKDQNYRSFEKFLCFVELNSGVDLLKVTGKLNKHTLLNLLHLNPKEITAASQEMKPMGDHEQLNTYSLCFQIHSIYKKNRLEMLLCWWWLHNIQNVEVWTV